KEIGDKQYFTSINLETNDYFISISNAPKKENILKNKVENGAEVVYQSPTPSQFFTLIRFYRRANLPPTRLTATLYHKCQRIIHNL
ncbi:hypothetical protein, partial [Helicobacter cinaedi]|uniref:hypothetical protein n=1 Tax=Helicobacter cinaedi TaxID=213 RepID=UPI0015F05327